jgi:hypothetical protein
MRTKQFLSNFFLAAGMLLISPVFAAPESDVKVVKTNGDFIASVKTLDGMKVPLLSSGGVPAFIKWLQIPDQPKNILILLYKSGQAGTSTIYEITRGVVINKDSKKVIADLVFSYTPVGHNKIVQQPKWNIKNKTLHFVDNFFYSEQDISLE